MAEEDVTPEPPFDVPLVDVSAWTGPGEDGARRAVVQQVDKACREVGFIQIRGHGIPETVIEGLAEAMDVFFAQPGEVKSRYRTSANRGYSPPKSESLSLSLGVAAASRMNDFFEAFNVGVEARSFPGLGLSEEDYGTNLWPDLPGFREAVEVYFEHAAAVARTLTTIFAAALQLAPDFFARLTDHSIDVLRMNNYALSPGEVGVAGELTGMGEHTDYGLVTVLWADRVAGLQVLGRDERWHDVIPVPGALLVNLGDLTARLTNDTWMSTLHRVKPPVVDGQIKTRRSAAFFHDGNVDAVISTLPGLLEAAGDQAYPPITVRDHIAAKLGGSRQGKANLAAVREAARVMAAQR